MYKLWQVAVFEYRRNVFKKSFLITLLSVPLFIALIAVIGVFMESGGDDPRPVGIVDQAGVVELDTILPLLETAWADKYAKPVDFLPFQSPETALAALEANQLQAYFLLPPDYPQTRDVEVIFTQEPATIAWQQLNDLLRAALLSGQTYPITQRIIGGAGIMVRSVDGSRQIPINSGPTFGLLMPLVVAMAVLALLLICSGYITGAIADEKENRTMEVLVTTISPLQLIGGKILGITAISLTLLVCWLAVSGLGIFLARLAGVAWFLDIHLDWGMVIASLAIGLPSYVLAIALMTAIGVIVTTTQEGQSLSTIFFILFLVPLYISWGFFRDPHSPLAVALSFLPFTALITVAMRNLFTIVPAWQVCIGALVQAFCAIGAIWLASRAFRLGMLQYGQRLSFRNLFPTWTKPAGGRHA